MRLLFIHNGLDGGGISTVIMHRLNYLAENTNFEIHHLSEMKNDANLEAKLNKRIQVHCLDFKKLLSKKRAAFVFVDQLIFRKRAKNLIQNYIDKIQPDIITSLDEGKPRNLIPFIQTSAAKIVEFHSNVQRKKINRKLQNQSQITKLKNQIHPANLIYGNLKKTHNKYDYAISLTNEDLEDRKYLKIKKRQIYNTFAEPKKISKFYNRDNIIIGVGRLVAEKNFEDLLTAINLIKDQIGSWKIYIYGKGPQESLLNQKITNQGLSEIVYLKGFAYNIQEVYNNSKILISTSLTEAHPRNILEALFFKIPVISYNCKSGPKEMITDGVNGFLTNFNVQELADKIIELTSNPEMLNQFSENTSQDLHKFKEEKIMNEWIDFYNSIVE